MEEIKRMTLAFTQWDKPQVPNVNDQAIDETQNRPKKSR